MARRLAPRLARVGVAWNPSEANSEACTKVARTVCKELGIELLEANVEGSAAVREAVASLVGRGAEAIWVGGDNTVLSSLDAVIGPARAAGVPVFTSIPGCAERGALFDLGADYYRVGESVGRLAGRVLDGESPADMPILYEVPPEFWINRVALKSLERRLVLSRRDRRQGRRRGRKGGPGPTPPARGVAARAPDATAAVADLEDRPGRVQRVDHPGRGDRGVAAGSQRGRPRRGARLHDELPQRPGRYRHAQRHVRRAERRRHRPGRQLLHAGLAVGAAEGRSEAGRLRRRARSDRRGGRKVGLGPPAERDRGLPRLPLRRDGPDGPRGLAAGSPGRHALRARRGQLRRGPAAVRGVAQGRGARAGEPAGQWPDRGERRGPHPLPVGGRRPLPDLGQPEQLVVPGDRPGVRDGEDAALHVLAVAW